jgi:hypothetical protein
MGHGTLRFLFRHHCEERFGMLRMRRTGARSDASLARSVAGLGQTFCSIGEVHEGKKCTPASEPGLPKLGPDAAEGMTQVAGQLRCLSSYEESAHEGRLQVAAGSAALRELVTREVVA